MNINEHFKFLLKEYNLNKYCCGFNKASTGLGKVKKL